MVLTMECPECKYLNLSMDSREVREVHQDENGAIVHEETIDKFFQCAGCRKYIKASLFKPVDVNPGDQYDEKWKKARMNREIDGGILNLGQ